MGDKAVKVSLPALPVEPRKVEFGDSVGYMAGERKLDATVMVAFADGGVHLRVLDPSNPWGSFDVKHPVYDPSGAPGTWQ